MKYKKEKDGSKSLLKLLQSRFSADDEDSMGWDEDMGDQEESDDFFDREGFGDPMDTFVNPKKRKKTRQDDSNEDSDMMYDNDEPSDDEFNEIADENEEDEDMNDEDMMPSKDHRKNLAVITITKKIGKNKAKKM